MANKEHLDRLEQEGVAAWNSWRNENQDVRPDLSEADLRGQDLSEANLARANLVEAQLSHAQLVETVFDQAVLRDAELRFAVLKGAKFGGANLQNADLSGADLLSARFSATDLRGASFRAAELTGANFERVDLREADLAGASGLNALIGTRTVLPDAMYVADAENEPVSLRNLAETFGAVAAVPTLLVYPLGLVMLAVQLFSYAPQLVTDWYASSLVLTTFVAGHGARLLFLPFVIVLTVSMLIAFGAYRRDLDRKVGGQSRWTRWLSILRNESSRSLFYSGIIVFIVLLIIALLFGIQNVLLVPVSAILGVFGGLVIYSDFRQTGLQEMNLLRGVSEGWLLRGLILAYVGGLVSALAIACVVQNVPLPVVKIEETDNAHPPTHVCGLFLSHSEQHWYILYSPDIVNSHPLVDGDECAGNVASADTIRPKEAELLRRDDSSELMLLSSCVERRRPCLQAPSYRQSSARATHTAATSDTKETMPSTTATALARASAITTAPATAPAPATVPATAPATAPAAPTAAPQHAPEVQGPERQEPEKQEPEGQEAERQEPERQEPEKQESEQQEPERQEPERQEAEIQDEEIQDDENEDTEDQGQGKIGKGKNGEGNQDAEPRRLEVRELLRQLFGIDGADEQKNNGEQQQVAILVVPDDVVADVVIQ